jgi:hypothetical protein
MVSNGVHLLEFGHVDVTESSSFAFWFGNLPPCCTDTPKGLLGLTIFAILLLLLCKHLCLDSCGFFPHILHQFLGFITEV